MHTNKKLISKTEESTATHMVNGNLLTHSQICSSLEKLNAIQSSADITTLLLDTSIEELDITLKVIDIQIKMLKEEPKKEETTKQQSPKSPNFELEIKNLENIQKVITAFRFGLQANPKLKEHLNQLTEMVNKEDKNIDTLLCSVLDSFKEKTSLDSLINSLSILDNINSLQLDYLRKKTPTLGEEIRRQLNKIVTIRRLKKLLQDHSPLIQIFIETIDKIKSDQTLFSSPEHGINLFDIFKSHEGSEQDGALEHGLTIFIALLSFTTKKELRESDLELQAHLELKDSFNFARSYSNWFDQIYNKKFPPTGAVTESKADRDKRKQDKVILGIWRLHIVCDALIKNRDRIISSLSADKKPKKSPKDYETLAHSPIQFLLPDQEEAKSIVTSRQVPSPSKISSARRSTKKVQNATQLIFDLERYLKQLTPDLTPASLAKTNKSIHDICSKILKLGPLTPEQKIQLAELNPVLYEKRSLFQKPIPEIISQLVISKLDASKTLASLQKQISEEEKFIKRELTLLKGSTYFSDIQTNFFLKKLDFVMNENEMIIKSYLPIITTFSMHCKLEYKDIIKEKLAALNRHFKSIPGMIKDALDSITNVIDDAIRQLS